MTRQAYVFMQWKLQSGSTKSGWSIWQTAPWRWSTAVSWQHFVCWRKMLRFWRIKLYRRKTKDATILLRPLQQRQTMTCQMKVARLVRFLSLVWLRVLDLFGVVAPPRVVAPLRVMAARSGSGMMALSILKCFGSHIGRRRQRVGSVDRARRGCYPWACVETQSGATKWISATDSWRQSFVQATSCDKSHRGRRAWWSRESISLRYPMLPCVKCLAIQLGSLS